MHNLFLVKVRYRLAYVSEVALYLLLGHHLRLDLIEQRASFCVLEDHVCGLPLPIDVVA